MATRKDVAQRAGVSVATVSYVMNQSKNVTAEVRNRVLRAIEDLQYRPNLIARSLSTKQTRHVAMIVDNLKNPYYCEMLEGAQAVAAKNGYIVSVLSVEQSNAESLLELAGRGVDGAILTLGGNTFSDNILENLRDIPRVTASGVVTLSYADAIYEMVRTLRELGHVRIAFLSGIPLEDPNHERYLALREAMRAFGLTLHSELLVDARPFEKTDEIAGEAAMLELFERDTPFTAVFALNDLMALGAAKALRAAGLSIPWDVSLVGCDHLAILDTISPTLSTIDVQSFEVGGALMTYLIATIEKHPLEKKAFRARFLRKESIAPASKTEHQRFQPYANSIGILHLGGTI